MANITTREVGVSAVNRTLTNAELDNNFINLNTDIGTRIPSSEKGSANGVASLDATGKVPTAQLPSYVDDVLEAANLAAFPATGEAAKIYVALDTNKTYRWSGSAYVYITSGAVDSVAGKTGVVTLDSSDVTTALGYTPYNATNPSGFITAGASITGNAATATALGTARTINGVSFNGSANVTVTTAGTGIGVSGTAVSIAAAYSPNTATELAGSFDLNTLQTPGFYAQSTNADATSGLNYPNAQAGSIVVQDSAGVTQQYYTYNPTSTEFYFRAFYNTVWSPWHRALTDTNFNSYSPTLTGTGASGTWGISVTGNAATATALQTARTIGGVSFNGTANINLPGVNVAGNQNTTGTAAGLTDNSAWMLSRGSVATASIDTATLNGFYTQTNASDSQGLLVFNAGGSLGPLQMTFTYGGLMQLRNKTDSTTWTAWKTVLTSANYNSYSPTLTGSGASGSWGISVTGSAGSVAWSGVTGKPTTLAGYGITDAASSSHTHSYLPLSGGTLTGSLYWPATAGVGNGNSRSLLTGFSGGNYGQTGYGITYTGTSGLHNYALNDIVSMWEAYDGLRVYAAAAGTVGTAITWTTVLDARRSNSALIFKGQTVLDAGNYTSYAASATHYHDRIYNGAVGTGPYLLLSSTNELEYFNNAGTIQPLYIQHSGVASDLRGPGGNIILQAGNYNSYSPTLTGGGASGTWGISVTGSAASATNALRIVFDDGPRDLTNRLPNTFTRTINFDFVGASVGNGSGNYAGVMTFAPWTGTTASTGDSSYQLAFANTTGVNAAGQPKLSIRNGIDTTWNAWYTLLHSGNYTSYSPSLTGSGASGTWGISITGNAATLGGYGPNQTGGVNTIVQRDSNGYIQNSYFYSSGGGSERNGSGLGYFAAYNSSDYYIRSYTAAAAAAAMGALTTSNYTSYSPTLTGGSASGTWGINITGSSPYLSALGNYVWSVSTLPTGYNQGIQCSFVQGPWQSYGSVMTMNTYSGGGGALQLYVPYSPTYGGTGLQVRFGNYDVSSGNSWTGWKVLLASDNYTSYAPSLTGSGASGTWGISITGSSASTTGNAATATILQTARTINGVSFNGSANITVADSTKLPLSGGTLTGNVISPKLLMNRSGSAATGIGWYSSSYSAWTQYMSPAAATGCGPYGNITAPSGSLVTSWALRSFVENAGGYGWTWESGTSSQVTPTVVAEILASDGSFRSASNITAYSDERLKTNWRPVKLNFVKLLSEVKCGIYDRLDFEITQAGVSAQAWQKVLPETVTVGGDAEQTLSVNYGNAALVSAVELAKDNVELRARIERLESLIEKLLNKE